MATPIGVNTLTAVTDRYVMPTIQDAIYPSNIVLYRLMKGNKKLQSGGNQIEVPFLYARFNAGGAFRGFDVLDTTPADTVKNIALDWKQHYVPFSIDGLTLIKNDSPDSIASIVQLNSQQAKMEMAENLAAGLFGDGLTDVKDIDGFRGAVGNASVGNANYGGVARSTNSWLNSNIDAATGALTFAALQSWFGSGSVGGQHYTLLLSRQEQYNRFIALYTAAGSGYSVQQARTPEGHDEMLASAGFTNALFNNTPWVVDSHVDNGPSASNSRIYGLNENVLFWVVSTRADFYVDPFQKPINQNAFVTNLYWAGNLICANPKLQGALTNISA